MTGPALEWRIYYGLDTRIDQLLAGCALAAVLSAGWGRLKALRQVVRYAYLPCLAFILYLIVPPSRFASYSLLAGQPSSFLWPSSFFV